MTQDDPAAASSFGLRKLLQSRAADRGNRGARPACHARRPEGLAGRAHTAHRAYPPSDLTGMLKENLIAARIVIEVSHETIRWIDGNDPTTRRLLEGILEQEERHAGVLRKLLGAPDGGQAS